MNSCTQYVSHEREEREEIANLFEQIMANFLKYGKETGHPISKSPNKGLQLEETRGLQ